ncbi:MAG: hypothetical protein H0U76_03500 [Ktedonobacteraceae bacterium]|nr:hypothetical protein [Ktedonobacteraceae bacterium]
MRKDVVIRETSPVPQFTSTEEFENYLPASPLLSSRETEWQHVTVRTYHEPSELEETFFPGCSDIYLVLITSGSVQVGERQIDGPWATYSIHKGGWFLTPARGEPYAMEKAASSFLK